MPTNKNAQLRYQILDRCFSDFKHKYTFEDLREKVNDALYDLTGIEVSTRQIRADIKYMRDRVTFDAPIKAYPMVWAKNTIIDMKTLTSPYIIMICPSRR